MKQIKVIFKSGADFTIWVKEYEIDYRGHLVTTTAEGHPNIVGLNNAEIAAVLELA